MKRAQDLPLAALTPTKPAQEKHKLGLNQTGPVSSFPRFNLPLPPPLLSTQDQPGDQTSAPGPGLMSLAGLRKEFPLPRTAQLAGGIKGVLSEVCTVKIHLRIKGFHLNVSAF